MQPKIDTNYYPGWTRKSLSFTIDDGNVPLDRKFLSIVSPHGIRGTFNLCGHTLYQLSPEEYRAFYKGNGISNHSYGHPYLLERGKTYLLVDEPFDEKNADPAYIYPGKTCDGYYWFMAKNGWREIVGHATYMHMVDLGLEKIGEIFGKENVDGYVWPYHDPKDPTVFDYIVKQGYRSIRCTGETGNSTDFSLPADRLHWTYTATVPTLLSLAAEYDAAPDNGKLRFFCFGVHSADFEAAGKWGALEEYAARMGDRPDDFWYAPVGDIFTYEDAVNALEITDDAIRNPSSVDVYIKIDSKKTVVPAGKTVNL